MGVSLSLSARCAVAATAVRNSFISRRPQLSFLTDFGTGDEAVYAVKSAAKFVNPAIEAEDVCHNVPLGNILLGAWRLQRAVTLHTEGAGTAYVAVVDPGVGAGRKNIIVRTKDRKYLIGPDNGVLSLAFSSSGVDRAVEIRNQDLTLLHLARSRTFHGKDVFAPAAAHILRGVPLKEFGPELDAQELAKITISAEATDKTRSGYLVDIDGFGSIRTNVPNHVPEHILGRLVDFEITGPVALKARARVVRTFAEAGASEPVFVLSSTGCLDLAIIRGSASEVFGILPGHITVGPELRPENSIRIDLSGST